LSASWLQAQLEGRDSLTAPRSHHWAEAQLDTLKHSLLLVCTSASLFLPQQQVSLILRFISVLSYYISLEPCHIRHNQP